MKMVVNCERNLVRSEMLTTSSGRSFQSLTARGKHELLNDCVDPKMRLKLLELKVRESLLVGSRSEVP